MRLVGPHITAFAPGYSRDNALKNTQQMNGKHVMVLNDAVLCKQLLDQGFQPIFRVKDGHWDDDNAHQHFDASLYVRMAYERLRMAGAEAAYIHWNNEPGEWDLPVLKREFRAALEEANRLGVKLVALNIAYRNWTMAVWDYLADELALARLGGHFIGVHEGYHREFPDIESAVPECIGRYVESSTKYGFNVIVTEFTWTWLPDYGWSFWLTDAAYVRLIRDAVEQVYSKTQTPICIFTLYPWMHNFDIYQHEEVKDGIRSINNEDFSMEYDIAEYIVPQGPNYGLGGVHGSSGYEIVQSRRLPNGYGGTYKNNTLERIWFDDRYIYRGIDTSSISLDYVYAQFTGTTYGAPWCGRYMRLGEVFNRVPDIVTYKANGQIVKRDQNVASQFKFVSHVSSKTFPETGVTVRDVAEFHWIMGGKVLEVYWYAKGIGLVGFGAEGIPGGYHSRIANLNETRTPTGTVPAWFVEPVPPPVQSITLTLLGNARMAQNGVRIRQQPTTSAAVLKTTRTGDLISVSEPTPKQIANGYTWYFVQTSDNVGGWAASPIGTASWEFIAQQDKEVLNLNLIYVSQIDSASKMRNNDCGIACALSGSLTRLAKVGYGAMPLLTIDNIFHLTPLKDRDDPLTMAQLADILKQVNVPYQYSRDLTPANIRTQLRSGKPVLVLINYKVFDSTKHFGHYAIVVGLTENGGFVVNDPYLKGEGYQLSEEQLIDGMTDVAGFASIPNQGYILTI